MYGFPKDFDPLIFVGRELETITYAVNVIVLVFADRLTVSASGSLSYRIANDAETGVDRPPVIRTSFVSLVGRTVLAAELKSTRELVLEFDGGGSVTLLDDAGIYECYLISIGDREIIV
jgi:hypothetical protein